MHGWFLPALGLAVLGGAGVAALATRLRPVWVGAVLAAMFVDMLVFNQLLNPLAYARQSFDTLYGVPLRAFAAEVQAAQPPPLERLYGPPLASVGYRNHPLQSHIETTYGYNPLELAAYSDYVDAAEGNPRLIDGMAATHTIGDDLTIRPNLGALSLAYFARRVVVVPDAAAAAVLLAELDPGVETVVIGLPGLNVANADLTATAHVVERGDDHLTIHVQTNTANVLRVAIPMFPGWHASRNGAELPLVSADLAFQGILVPAGEGDVHLQYMPRWFELGALISLLALLVCLAVLGRAAVVQRGAHRRRVTSAGRHNRARGRAHPLSSARLRRARRH
jgi:hypothetical protein